MSLIAAWTLAVVLLAAAVAKVANRPQTRTAVIALGVPARLAAGTAILVPVAEAGTAALLFSPARRLGGVLALVLLLAFTLTVARTLAQGRRPRCRCFGGLGAHPIGARTLLRNAALGVLAGVALLPNGVRPRLETFGWLAAATLGAVAAAAFLAVLEQQGRLAARLAAVESRAPAGPRPAPSFRLPDRNGLLWESAQLDAGQGLTLLFVDKDCRTCHDALDRMIIAAAGPGALALVVRQADREWPPPDQRIRVLVDAEGSVAGAYDITAVPSAVFIEPDGWIRTDTAVGADAVVQAARAPL